jgi:uncharacterized protein
VVIPRTPAASRFLDGGRASTVHGVQELIVPLTDGPLSVPYVDVTGASPGPHLTVTVGGSTSAVAADLRIPSITAEAGQNGILDRASIDRHLTGLVGVTRLLGIDRRPADGAAPTIAPAEHDGWVWLRTSTAGWWEPAVAVGTDVDAGDLLGTVSGLLGDDRVEIRAPEPGVPLFITSSPAVAADGLLMGLARAAD